MRTDEEGDPLVHRVQTDAEISREAHMGLDELLALGRAEQSREARERAAARTHDELEAVRQRRMRLAQAQADRFEWKPIAALAMFELQQCANCGTEHTVFRGFGTLLRRKSSSEERWSRAECLDKGLPFQQRIMPSRVPCCATCIELFASEGETLPYEFKPERKD